MPSSPLHTMDQPNTYQPKTCLHCGSLVSSGKYSRYPKYIKYYVCRETICVKCAQKGFCKDHYAKLSEEKKIHIQRIRRRYLLFVISIPILVVIGIFLLTRSPKFNYYIFDNYIYKLIFSLILAVFSLGMAFVIMTRRDKIIHQIIIPLRLSEGFDDKFQRQVWRMSASFF